MARPGTPATSESNGRAKAPSCRTLNRDARRRSPSRAPVAEPPFIQHVLPICPKLEPVDGDTGAQIEQVVGGEPFDVIIIRAALAFTGAGILRTEKSFDVVRDRSAIFADHVERHRRRIWNLVSGQVAFRRIGEVRKLRIENAKTHLEEQIVRGVGLQLNFAPMERAEAAFVVTCSKTSN